MGLSAGSRTLNNQSGTCAGRAHRRGTCSATAGHRTWWVMGRVTASSLRSWALLALALPSRAKPRCSHRSLFRFHATCLLTWGGKRVSTSTRRYFLVLLQFKQGPDQKDCLCDLLGLPVAAELHGGSAAEQEGQPARSNRRAAGAELVH